jgi:hypothetical protein
VGLWLCRKGGRDVSWDVVCPCDALHHSAESPPARRTSTDLVTGYYLEVRCLPEAHVFKDGSLGWCYREIVEPLRGEALWEIFKLLHMCP